MIASCVAKIPCFQGFGFLISFDGFTVPAGWFQSSSRPWLNRLELLSSVPGWFHCSRFQRFWDFKVSGFEGSQVPEFQAAASVFDERNMHHSRPRD